jgi:hypothetical protein
MGYSAFVGIVSDPSRAPIPQGVSLLMGSIGMLSPLEGASFAAIPGDTTAGEKGS